VCTIYFNKFRTSARAIVSVANVITVPTFSVKLMLFRSFNTHHTKKRLELKVFFLNRIYTYVCSFNKSSYNLGLIFDYFEPKLISSDFSRLSF